MGDTFLELTNMVLRKVNEIELTDATFDAASGFHSVVKDAVQFAVDDINQSETHWPFNYNQGSQLLTVAQQEYDFPDNVKVVGWETFFLQADDTLGANARALNFVEYTQYHKQSKVYDLTIEPHQGLPIQVYQTRNLKFGLSPLPDQAYTIEYDYWIVPARLENAADVCTVPEEYNRLIISWAIGEGYDFRNNYEMAGKEHAKYKRGLKAMRKILVPREYNRVYDTRTIRRRRSHGVDW